MTTLGFQTDAKYGIPEDVRKTILRSGGTKRPVFCLIINPDEDVRGVDLLLRPGGAPAPYVTPIGRPWWPSEPDKRLVYQGARGAQPYWDMLAPRAAKVPDIKLWTSPNEPAIDAGVNMPQSAANAKAVAAFLGEWFHILEDNGLHGVGPNFGTGHGYVYLWDYFMGIDWSQHYLGLHAYGMRTMDLEFYLNQWHLLRHEAIFARWRSKGVNLPRTIITETGIDWAGNAAQDGWQYAKQRWTGEQWEGPALTDAEYLQGLRNFALRVKANAPEIIGILPFIVRHPYWPGFEFTDKLLALYADFLQNDNAKAVFMPEDEPIMSVGMLADKVRWHTEQAVRELRAAGMHDQSLPMRRMLSLVSLERGLLYRLENAMKNGKPNG